MASPDLAIAATGPLPTTAAVAVRTLREVCLPLLRGGDPWTVATAAGFREQAGAWIIPIASGGRLVLSPPDRINPRLCSASITHPLIDEPALEGAIGRWAGEQTPLLRPVALGAWTRGATFLTKTSTWAAGSPGKSETLALTEVRTAQGEPIAGDLDRSNLQITVGGAGRGAPPNNPGQAREALALRPSSPPSGQVSSPS